MEVGRQECVKEEGGGGCMGRRKDIGIQEFIALSR